MLLSYTCSGRLLRNQLLTDGTWTYCTITDVLIHIRENMQSDMTGCNHTVAGTHTNIYIYIKFSILSPGVTKTNTFLEMSRGNESLSVGCGDHRHQRAAWQTNVKYINWENAPYCTGLLYVASCFWLRQRMNKYMFNSRTNKKFNTSPITTNNTTGRYEKKIHWQTDVWINISYCILSNLFLQSHVQVVYNVQNKVWQTKNTSKTVLQCCYCVCQ